MPDGFGGLLSAFQIAFDPDGRHTDELMGKGEGADPSQESELDLFGRKRKKKRGAPGGGGGGGAVGGKTESDMLGGFTYTTGDGRTYHGQEAMDMYEQDYPGEGGPHDGITGASGMYYGEGSWNPSAGDPHGPGGDAGDPYAR